MTPKRSRRLAAIALLIGASCTVLVAGIARGIGGVEQQAVAAPQTPTGCKSLPTPRLTPTVVVEDAPAVESNLIRVIEEAVATTHVTAVRLAGPPDSEFIPLPGYPGDRWLYIEVRLVDSQSCRVEQDWQAARLAGAVRNAAAAAALPIPFGYTIVGVLPDGSQSEPISITIGAPVGTESVPNPDRAAEAVRINRAVAAAGLKLRSLEFVGVDGAAVIRTQTTATPEDLIRAWPEIMRQLVENRPDSAWLLEIDSPDGVPIKAFANSPSTAGANGWSRPDLRILDSEVTNGG